MTKQNKAALQVHTGQLLRAYVNEKRINQAGWPGNKGVLPKTVAMYLKAADMRMGTLVAISQTLNYNFLGHCTFAATGNAPYIKICR